MRAIQGRYDLIVVGAGLAGLFAGAVAARRGAHTLVIARGLGGTHVGAGTVDVWGYKKQAAGSRQEGGVVESPENELTHLQPQHPLTLAGIAALREALGDFRVVCEMGEYPLMGELTRNHLLPTALGAVRPACLAPESFLAGDLRRSDELTLARWPGFRDFYADVAVENLRAQGHVARAVTLELPRWPMRRDAFASEIARWFDRSDYRAEVVQAWRDKLKGVTRLGLPAVVGLERPVEAQRDLQKRLGVEIFEIPILPPSVPGMRLFNVLRAAIETAGGRVSIGPRVSGWVEDGKVLGIIAETAGGARRYVATNLILATGGLRHGGLESPRTGQLREVVFDLPITTPSEFFAPMYWEAHPYMRCGVRVNENLQPITAKGEVIYPNVFAIGGLLAGADRTSEGSREGVDLATAWKAINGLNG